MKKKICFLMAFMVGMMSAMTGLNIMEVQGATIKEKPKERAYVEGEVLALVSEELPSSKIKASRVMRLQSDFQVKEIWNFDAPETADNGGSEGVARMQSMEDEFSVALIQSEGLDTEALMEELEDNPEIREVQPNYIIKTTTGLTNDTYSEFQWGLQNTGQNKGTAGSDIKVKSMWDKANANSKEHVIAVVDTGVDYTHEDLKGRIWENRFQSKLSGPHGFDFSAGDNDPMDENGHGTHCAGIIAAKSGNSAGISGVDQSAKIMALRVLDEEGEGDIAAGIAAYQYINKALNLGVAVTAVNNSWGGMTDEYECGVFEKVIDMLGQKGAVTVAAAGNEGEDVDKTMSLFASVQSPYLISVAASDENNKLVSFSNFGKNNVDLAAPGSAILSASSNYVYNPSVYDEAKRNSLSETFIDYNDKTTSTLQAGEWGNPEISGATNAIKEVTEEAYFGNQPGKSLKVSVANAKEGQRILLKIPYTISEEIENMDKAPVLSAMVKVNLEAEERVSMENIPLFLMEDVPLGTNMEQGDLLEKNLTGFYILPGEDGWSQLYLQSDALPGKQTQSRELYFVILCKSAGTYTVYIDDLGISKANINPEEFGKYEFMSGTSQATPHVTGAVGLLSGLYPDMSAENRVNTILSMVKKEDSMSEKTATGGVLDLSRPVAKAPTISRVSVDTSKKTITIEGNALSKAQSVTVNNKSAKIISSSQKKIVIQDQNWINRKVNIAVTSASGTAEKRDVYLVKGKKTLTLWKEGTVEDDEYDDWDDDWDDEEESAIEALATDGTRFYGADSATAELKRYNSTTRTLNSFMKLNTKRLFGRTASDFAEEQFVFGSDLAFLDGKFYNIASLVQAVEGEFIDFEDLFMNPELWEDSDNDDCVYARDFRLIAMDPTTKKTVSLGELPKAFDNITGWTMASYNGKLYVMGGFNHTTKTLSKQVKIYDPKTKKWSSGPSLPQGRALGKALQSGNSLIYTLGTGEPGSAGSTKCPKNLVLSGKTWKIKSAEIKPYENTTVKQFDKNYTVYDGSIALRSGGLIYLGIPAEGLGDIFTWSASSDRYTPAAVQFIQNIGRQSFEGITVGSVLYGYDNTGALYKGGVTSGLVKVTASKKTGGSIKGSNKGYMPGTSVTLKASPNKGYYVKSFKVSGNTVKGTSKTIRITANTSASAVFGKYYVKKITLNKTKAKLKAGKTLKLTAKVSPTNAADKRLTWKSSNTKYATVSSKGVVKAKKAGIGKTVTIKVKARDGSGKIASCKVRIVR